MAITVNVGYSKKLGQPDFGSIGASCHLECEFDGRLAFDEPEKFQAKVRDLYTACVGAVQEELARRSAGQSEPPATAKNGSRKTSRNGTANGNSPANSKGVPNHHASARQIDYLERLAREIPSVGIRRLEALAQQICNKPMAALSSFDASSLIDTLKAIKEGRLDLDAALKGAGG